MGSRVVWPVVLALAAAGMLLAHEAAYRLTGTSAGGDHGYLAHAPQVLLALVLPAALLAASATRRGAPRPRSFALLGLAGFTALEHLERLGSGVPLLLTSPVFACGLLLQLPFALAAWWVARALLRLEPAERRRPPALPRRFLPLLELPAAAVAVAPVAAPGARGPPRLR